MEQSTAGTHFSFFVCIGFDVDIIADGARLACRPVC